MCTPALHFAARWPWDRCRTLWGGFALKTPAGRIYFAGDSGYSDTFGKIGARLGPFDLSFLPIGAYEPRLALAAARLAHGVAAADFLIPNFGETRVTPLP